MSATAARLALVADGADGIEAFAESLHGEQYEMVGVLVAPTEYLMARSVVGSGIRCATHAAEFATIAVDVCVTLCDDGVLERYGDILPRAISAEDFERIRGRDARAETVR